MTTFCRTCNKALDFIDTKAGKKMPVEHTSFTGRPDGPLPYGSYINAAGVVLKHTEVPAGMVVWRVHFQDCEKETARAIVTDAYAPAVRRRFEDSGGIDRIARRTGATRMGRHEMYAWIRAETDALLASIVSEATDIEIQERLLVIANTVVFYLVTGDKYGEQALFPPPPALVEGWITDEVISAVMKHGDAPWTLAEAVGILTEEVEEVFDNIRANGNPGELQKELIQVAAVCMRHLVRPED